MQLFQTSRKLEEAAEFCLPMLETVLRHPTMKGQARSLLHKCRERLHAACELFEQSEIVDDEGGPYVIVFDALSFVSLAAGSFEPQRNHVRHACDLLRRVARV